MAIGPAQPHEFVRSTFDPDLCEDCGNRARQDPHVEDMSAFNHRQYRESLGNR